MEFTDEELDLLKKWFTELPVLRMETKDMELANRIHLKSEERKELANMDFNECEGGACVL